MKPDPLGCRAEESAARRARSPSGRPPPPSRRWGC